VFFSLDANRGTLGIDGNRKGKRGVGAGSAKRNTAPVFSLVGSEAVPSPGVGFAFLRG
jgi:hypothetical protein